MKGPVCGFKTKNGPCTFSIDGDGSDNESIQAALMTSHRELEHGYPALVSASVYHDENRQV